jgi:hypothetical protein
MDALGLVAAYLIGYQIGADRDARTWTPELIHKIPVFRPSKEQSQSSPKGPMALPKSRTAFGPYVDGETEDQVIEGEVIRRY